MKRNHRITNKGILPAMAAIFVDVLSYGLITPLLVAAFAENIFLADNPALQPLMLALAFALFPLGMFFGAVILGDLSDRWGRRKTLMLCMAGLTLAFSAMALSVALGSISLLLIGRLVSGLLGGSVAIGQAAIIDRSTPEDRPVNLSRITIANTSAHFLGPGIGALLADSGLYLPFICISLIAIATLIWIAFAMDESRRIVGKGDIINWQRPIQVFLDAFRHPLIRQLSLIYILFHAGNSMSYQFFYIFLGEKFDYSPSDLSLFSTIAMGGGGLITTFLILPWLQKRFTPMNLSIYALLSAGLLSMVFQSDILMALRWLTGFVWAIALVTAYVSTLALFSNCVEEERQGWAMGVASSVFAFSFVIGGLSAALLAMTSVEILICIAGLLLILAGALLYAIRKNFD
ncbi:hypothetical protein EOPP23_04630 [Endozoicomonas sp. OPT23]|uniref:MFS transporter n=1 Tax=Endozoicomonas sp. OPT23 TaxID=2072845 RepID=UPI00129AAC68|nr:MFS transporter [Endozoicomonas sp. OPT23]MRI32279.1 hypothetical protein [Endozoicomonas sp. OPT23]